MLLYGKSLLLSRGLLRKKATLQKALLFRY